MSNVYKKDMFSEHAKSIDPNVKNFNQDIYGKRNYSTGTSRSEGARLCVMRQQHNKIVYWSGMQNSTMLVHLLYEKWGATFDLLVQRRQFKDGESCWLPEQEEFYQHHKRIFEEDYGLIVMEEYTMSKTAETACFTKYGNHKFPVFSGKPRGAFALTRQSCYCREFNAKWLNLFPNCELYFGSVLHAYGSGNSNHTYVLKGKNAHMGRFPFIDAGITGNDVIRLYKERNLLPPPPKIGLGCFYCPYAKKEARDYIKYYYPEYVEKIKWLLEANPELQEHKILVDNNWYKDIYDIHECDYPPVRYNYWVRSHGEVDKSDFSFADRAVLFEEAFFPSLDEDDRRRELFAYRKNKPSIYHQNFNDARNNNYMKKN